MKQFVLTATLALCSVSACAGRQPQPNMASSADSTVYAARFPEQLEAQRALLAEEKTHLQTLSAALPARAKDLKTPFDSELVLSIVDAAEDAGRGEAFAAAHAEDRAVRTFWEEERGPIGSRVNNAVQQKATEAKCENTELTSSVPYALREGVDKQLEKRLRARNEGHLLVEQHKSALGQPNVAVMQKLADDVAMGSYLANIALVDDSNRIRRMLSDRRRVERTLNDSIEDEQKVQAAAQNAQERKASTDRLAVLTKSRDTLSSAATNAEGEIKTSDEQVRAARKEFDEAMDGLRDEIRKASLNH